MNLSLLGLWAQMGGFAKGIVIVLAIMSVWSLTVMISKFFRIRAAGAETRIISTYFYHLIEEEKQNEAIKI